MTDTDSEMMRRQQSKDAKVRLDPNELQARPEAKDSDPASGADRERAKAGESDAANRAIDAVFDENMQKGDAAILEENTLFENMATGGQAGLASPGRSRLKD